MAKLKTHDCTPKERKRIMKQNKNITGIRFDLANIVTWKGRVTVRKNQTGQRIWVRYNHKKKNGEVVEKTEKTFVTHRFCPFCGKKY